MSESVDGAKARSLSLSGIHLLTELPEAELRVLEPLCGFRRFAAGEVIVARFSSGNSVYFVVAGSARVVHYLPGEDEITIATVTAGDTVGDIAAIDGLGRSATIIADEEVTVAELSRSH
ncbi:MAG: cyclic nucleotide-binding domain-containing protein, partial [Stellaceae bacterium]